MSKNSNEGVNLNEAIEIIRKTAQAILNHPESVSLSNYHDAFDILEKGLEGNFNESIKKSIITKSGIAEAIVNNSNTINLDNYQEALAIISLAYPGDFSNDFRSRVLSQLGIT